MVKLRLILFILLAAISIDVASQIEIGTNFDLIAPLPIDMRMTVNDIAQRDTILWRYEGLSVYVESDSMNYQLQNGTTNAHWTMIACASDVPFDGNRYVSRSGLPLLNVGGTTLTDWVDLYFFPFIDATLSIHSSQLKEIGTSNSITVYGNLDPNDETGVSGGKLYRNTPTPIVTMLDFGTAHSYSTTVTFNPRQSPTAGVPVEQRTHTYQASTTGDSSGLLISSSTITFSSVYPYIYGLSTTDYSSGVGIYNGIPVFVITKSNKTITYNSPAIKKYIYYAYPSSYGGLTSIKDQNNFEWIDAFDKHTANVTSVGKVVDWTREYYIYKSKLKTSPVNWDFTFTY